MMGWNGRRVAALTRAVLERDGRRCAWCGGTATTADHIVPRSAGGPDTLANLQAACAACNYSRGNRARPTRPVVAPPSRTW